MTGSARSRWHHRMSGAVAVLVATAMLTLVPSNARAACTGDCNNSTDVTVDELLSMVNVALGNADYTTCLAGDANNDMMITIDEILAAVGNALSGCPVVTTPACGNGTVDMGEECDTGGTCVGGPNAGTHCTAESTCTGDGICLDGPKGEFACSGDGDCPSSKCIHCKTFGGATITGDAAHTCAANCTFETVVDVPLVKGDTPDNAVLTDGTSGLVVYSPGLNVAIPLPAPATPPNPAIVRHLSIGKQSNGKIPVVLKAATNGTPGVDVLAGMACICLRPITYRTCGGTLWEKDGTPSTNCTPGYTDGDSVCPAAKHCAFSYGPDNTGAGEIGCDGLDGVNVLTTQNSGGSVGIPGPILTTLSDAGEAGSGVLYVTSELGFTINTCTTTPGMMANVYGADGVFCTADDPFTTPDPATTGRSVLAQVLTTGTASSEVINANQTDNNIVCVGSPADCFALPGKPFNCTALAASPPSASGAALAGAFPDLNAPVIIDIVVTNIQVAQ